jgi:CheY-like chemotaxis protein
MHPDENVGSFVILVADDEPMVRKVAAAMLEREGYKALLAETGQEAVRVLSEYRGAVHLVLCDIRMPGPSGLELRNLILEQWPATKVVLLSGDTSFDGIPDDVLKMAKPFTLDFFRKEILDLLGLG